MKLEWNNKRRGLVIGSIGTVFVVVFLALFALTLGKEDTSAGKVADAGKIPEAKTAASPRKAKTKKAVNLYHPPVSNVPESVQASFPEPTENTIVVASKSQLVKLDTFQNPLSEDAKQWDCVTDRTTGLVWEVKTNDLGLQDANNYYSWYNTNDILNLGFAGQKDNGKCRGGIDCDTQSYVNAINKKGYCGYSDWRLPSRKDLQTLVQSHTDTTENVMIDTRFFPRASGDWYWSSDSDAENPKYAWYVLYFNGRAMKAEKSRAKRIRLVRGGPFKSFKDVARNPQSDKGDSIAKDKPAPRSILQSRNEELVAQPQ